MAEDELPAVDVEDGEVPRGGGFDRRVAAGRVWVNFNFIACICVSSKPTPPPLMVFRMMPRGSHEFPPTA